MRTKKVIAGLLAAGTLASVSVSAIVSAEDGFGVGISNTTAEAGGSFTLTLDMSNIPDTGLNGCDFGISYDSSLVTVESVELGALAKDVSGVETDLPSPFECNIDTDIISIMYALGTVNPDYYLTGSGTFLSITGTVKETAAAGDKADFKIVPIDRAVKPGDSATNASIIFGYMSSDEAITVYDPVFTDGYVEVTGDVQSSTEEGSTEDIPVGTKYGDVNVDGYINIADVVALNMYILDNESNALTAEGKANADCLRDMKIDAQDSLVLMNFVAMVVTEDNLGAAQ